jgi:hypothetical protein
MSDWDWLYWLVHLWWVWPLLAGGFGVGYVYGAMVGQARAWEAARANPWWLFVSFGEQERSWVGTRYDKRL